MGRELGDSDCSHEEDAGVRCDGESVSVKETTAPTSGMHLAIIMLCEFCISFPDFKASGTGNWWFLATANPQAIVRGQDTVMQTFLFRQICRKDGGRGENR